MNKELKGEHKLHLFHSSKKLFREKSLLDFSSSNEVFLLPLKERRKHFKILHSVDHNKDEILHVNCLTTDSVLEVKNKFLQDHFQGQDFDEIAVYFSRPLSNSLLSDDDAVNKTLYISAQKPMKDMYPIVSGSESEDEDLFRIVDLVAHVGVKGCIGVTVKHTKSHQFRKSKFALIDKNGSSESLRHQIGIILHQDPLCLKLSIGGKDIPEIISLAGLKELKPGCTIFAKVKPKLVLIVEGDTRVERIEAKAMEKISDIKEKIATSIQLPVKMFDLSHAGSVLHDHCTLNDHNIESEVVLQLVSYEKRIEVKVKVMTGDVFSPGSVKPKFDSLSVDDPSNTRISDLKERLGAILAINPERLVLSLRGQNITTLGTIKEAGIKDGDTITVSATKMETSQKVQGFLKSDSHESKLSDYLSARNDSSSESGKCRNSGEVSDNGSLDVHFRSEEDIAADGLKENIKFQSTLKKYGKGSKSDTDIGYPRYLPIGPSEIMAQLSSPMSSLMETAFPKATLSYQSDSSTIKDYRGTNSSEREFMLRRGTGHVRSFSEGQRETIISTNIKAQVTSSSGDKTTLREFSYMESDVSNGRTSVSSETESCKMQSIKRDDLDRIFQEIAKEVHVSRWKFLARRLGVSESDIGDIDNNSRVSSEKTYQMLYMWRSQKGNLATAKILKEALREEKEEIVIDKIEQLEQTFDKKLETWV